jgi:hypothetical protein
LHEQRAHEYCSEGQTADSSFDLWLFAGVADCIGACNENKASYHRVPEGQMMRISRAVLAGLGAWVLSAASAPPPPPPDIAAYIADGRFEAGDYGWMRGAFADATPQQKDAYEALNRWMLACREAALPRMAEELAAIGVEAPSLAREMPQPPACRPPFPLFDRGRSFAEFEAVLRETRPIAETYIAAAQAAQTIALQNAATLGEALAARTMEEQLLRFGTASWGREPLGGAPELSSDQQAVLRSLINEAIARSDAANTAWLKAHVAQNGWPTISAVGERGAHAAWLLAQHADLDPVFQAQALRMMEPLAAQGEVSKRNYAYLYDRIMLKLTGKQRYGSQWAACEGGKRTLRPLEDEAGLAELRRQMDLEPVEDNARAMDELYGSCAAG